LRLEDEQGEELKRLRRGFEEMLQVKVKWLQEA
jgi:hypothetical protein